MSNGHTESAEQVLPIYHEILQPVTDQLGRGPAFALGFLVSQHLAGVAEVNQAKALLDEIKAILSPIKLGLIDVDLPSLAKEAVAGWKRAKTLASTRTKEPKPTSNDALINGLNAEILHQKAEATAWRMRNGQLLTEIEYLKKQISTLECDRLNEINI